MSIINFLFGNRTPSGFAISGIVEFQADLTNREVHEREAEVTDHPIETGSTISDHVILAPERVILEGFVTDTPTTVFTSNRGRTQDAFDLLEEAWASREPIQIVTGMKVYSDMIITRLSLPRERPSSMQFTIEAKRVRTAGTQFVVLPPEPIPEVEDQASEEADEGRQTADPVEPELEEEYSSILNDWFGRFVGAN